MNPPQILDRPKSKEKIVNEGVLMHRLFGILQLGRYKFSQDVFEKQLADSPVHKLSTTNLRSLENDEKTCLHFSLFTLTYSPRRLLGPSEAATGVYSWSGWSAFFRRLDRTPEHAFENFELACKFADINVARIDKYIYAINP